MKAAPARWKMAWPPEALMEVACSRVHEQQHLPWPARRGAALEAMGRGGTAPAEPDEEAVASGWAGCEAGSKAEGSSAPAGAEEGTRGPIPAGGLSSDSRGGGGTGATPISAAGSACSLTPAGGSSPGSSDERGTGAAPVSAAGGACSPALTGGATTADGCRGLAATAARTPLPRAPLHGQPPTPSLRPLYEPPLRPGQLHP